MTAAYTLDRTANTPARALNACLGAHDARWIALPDAKRWMQTSILTGTSRSELLLLAGALRNGRLRLSPKAAKYVAKIAPKVAPHLALAGALERAAR